MDVFHSCRNFDRVKEWAKVHCFTEELDKAVHTEEDLVIPVF
jgi:hypothetical protein